MGAFHNAQEPSQVQYDMWTQIQSQTNPSMMTYSSQNDSTQYRQQQKRNQVASNSMWIDAAHPTPVSSLGSLGSDVCDTFQKFAMVNMPPKVGEMRSVTSQGMLLPLVQMPDSQKPRVEENPKQQMTQCMNTIEEALQDPALADAGKVLLKAMQASSSYMSGLLESRRAGHSPAPVPSIQNSSSPLDGRYFLNNVVQPREVLFPELPSSKSKSVDPIPSNPQVVIAPMPAAQLDPAQVTPVLSSRPSPADPTKSPQSKALEPAPKAKPVAHKAACGRVEKKAKPVITTSSSNIVSVSPHQFLMDMLRDRGHSTDRITFGQGGYHTSPTPLQLASFGTHMVQAVNNSDTETVSKLLGCGLSPNPCNQFGDAILSLICKRANDSVFSVFMEHGCDLRVCDSFGRTPLHHLAWAGQFSGPIASAILERDRIQVLMEDKQGKCPMECVRRDQWDAWIDFWKKNVDLIMPKSDAAEATMVVIPRSGPVVDPLSAVSPSLATKIAAGAISPEEAMQMKGRATSPPMISLDFSLF